MNALDRLLIAAAVAISPDAHRETRREQWAADAQDAAELDLSPTALAFGAITTAIFHRRADRRTTWGTAFTAAPLDVRPEPHRIRTVPVLVAVAILSLVASGVWLVLQPNYGYASGVDRIVGIGGLYVLLFLIPGTALALSAMVLTTGTTRRRAAAATIIAAAVTAVLAPLLLPSESAVVAAVLMLAAVAVWFVAARTRGWAWTLIGFPAIVFFLLWNGTLYQVIPTRFSPFLVPMPYIASILAGIVASRFSTDLPRRFVAAEGALVDKSV